jgi:hypothetical protein
MPDKLTETEAQRRERLARVKEIVPDDQHHWFEHNFPNADASLAKAIVEPEEGPKGDNDSVSDASTSCSEKTSSDCWVSGETSSDECDHDDGLEQDDGLEHDNMYQEREEVAKFSTEDLLGDELSGAHGGERPHDDAQKIVEPSTQPDEALPPEADMPRHQYIRPERVKTRNQKPIKPYKALKY